MRFLRRVWDWLDFWVFDTAFFDAFVVCGWVGLLGLYVLRFVSLRAFFFWIFFCFFVELFVLGWVLRHPEYRGGDLFSSALEGFKKVR